MKSKRTINVGDCFGTDSMWTYVKSGKYAYVEFEVIAISGNLAAIKFLNNATKEGKERATIPLTTIMQKCVLIDAESTGHSLTKVVNVIRTIIKKAEVYISEYNDTWIDRLYNRYCDIKGRTRSTPQELVIDEEIKEAE